MSQVKHLSLSLIMVEDPTTKGYTAFFAQFPEILAEGKTDKEAEANLLNTVQAAFEYNAKELPHFIAPGNSKVIKRDINFEIA